MNKKIKIEFGFENKPPEYPINDPKNIIQLLETNNKVLVFGDVQSGKTKNILSLIEISLFSNKYDIVVLFGGTSNLLLSQTQSRFNTSKTQKDGLVYLDKKNIEDCNFDLLLENNKTIFINTMKERANLTKLFEKLNVSAIKDKRLLVIDDESDFGSVNTSKTNEAKAVFSTIRKILNLSNFNKYCMFTATPYANIVNSLSDDLKAEVVYFLTPPSTYNGIEFFKKNNYIYKEIENIKNSDLNEKEIWDIVIRVIKYFLVMNAGYNVLEEKKKFELVFNINRENKKQKFQMLLINDCLQELSNYLSFFNWKKYFKDELELLRIRTDLIVDEDLLYKEIISIYEELKREENQILLNNNETNEYVSDGSQNRIIIGGDLISRGFTFKNLLMEVMCNVPNGKISADTHAQRARWLGYRNDYYKYMIIFMPKNSIQAYNEIIELNTFMKNEAIDNKLIVDNILIEELKNMIFHVIDITGGVKKC